MAMLNGEPAAQTVDDLLRTDREVVMSWINLGEVAYIVQRHTDEGTAADTVRDIAVSLEVRLPSTSHVMAAAKLKAGGKMSYADAFAASMAQSLKFELWTGDPELLREEVPWGWRDLRQPDDVVSWSPRTEGERRG
jgi:predicted nucleic acid-binding protein